MELRDLSARDIPRDDCARSDSAGDDRARSKIEHAHGSAGDISSRAEETLNGTGRDQARADRSRAQLTRPDLTARDVAREDPRRSRRGLNRVLRERIHAHPEGPRVDDVADSLRDVAGEETTGEETTGERPDLTRSRDVDRLTDEAGEAQHSRRRLEEPVRPERARDAGEGAGDRNADGGHAAGNGRHRDAQAAALRDRYRSDAGDDLFR